MEFRIIYFDLHLKFSIATNWVLNIVIENAIKAENIGANGWSSIESFKCKYLKN